MGYVAEKEKVHIDGRNEEHTVCVPEEDSDAYMCNGFGHFNKHRQTCDCNDGFAGDFCEMCDNYEFEYPDCTGEMLASYMDSHIFDAFNRQRFGAVYHEDYHMG